MSRSSPHSAQLPCRPRRRPKLFVRYSSDMRLRASMLSNVNVNVDKACSQRTPCFQPHDAGVLGINGRLKVPHTSNAGSLGRPSRQRDDETRDEERRRASINHHCNVSAPCSSRARSRARTYKRSDRRTDSGIVFQSCDHVLTDLLLLNGS